MSLQGGNWVWTASLRYAYMLAMLSAWLVVAGKSRILKAVLVAYRNNWCFWTMAGSLGFGAFYSLLTFSASFAPGWVVAATWQSTILATPVILVIFGRKVPIKGLLFTALIFLGILLITYEQASSTSAREMILGIVPVIGAAFAYPVGNQLLWEARHGRGGVIPRIDDPILDNSMARVLLMVLGSLPFWIALLVVQHPPPPSTGQLVSTAIVAVFSGVVATTLFFHARHRAKTTLELSAVDATQSTEVIFSLLGEIIFLHGSFPGIAGSVGIGLSVIGLILYVRSQAVEA